MNELESEVMQKKIGGGGQTLFSLASRLSPFSIQRHPQNRNPRVFILNCSNSSNMQNGCIAKPMEPSIRPSLPLVNLWGFGPVSRTRIAIPTEEEVRRALGMTGLAQLKLLPDGKLQKQFSTLQLDLSGSAKGEIIDLICDLLDRWGFNNYLVEIGGEIRAEGKGRNGKGWVVGLEDGRKKCRGYSLRTLAKLCCGHLRKLQTY